MIKKLNIANQATIKNLEIEPYKINYFFGGNGSGKTTISKFLSDPSNLQNGSIVNDTDSEILVYNKSFVDANFRDKNAIQGIFTIGESAVEAVTFIEAKEKEKREIETAIDGYQKRIDSLQEETDKLVEEYEKNCWNIERELGETFSKALVGFRRSAKSFAQKCKESFTGTVFDCKLESLISTYNQIYQKEIKEYALLEQIKVDLTELETNDILSQSIVKSTESNFSKFIEKLGNINWVSQGVQYLDDSEICPFCQQKISSPNLQELRKLFDETYTQALDLLISIKASYKLQETEINKVITKLLDDITNIPFISTDKLTLLKDKIANIIAKNQEVLSQKILNPATPCQLEKSLSIINEINEEIMAINKAIIDNNELAKNITKARTDFSVTLWNYIANNKLFSTNEQFAKTLLGKNKGMHQVLNYKKIKEDEKALCVSAISEKRAGIVCIDNAVEEINELLKGFGFNGFKIEKKDEMSYRLIRADGSEVKETLSEGEHRFITFLYFYQLVKGTLNKDATTKNKILVIDDPISSLDSNILFIVSYLVRALVSKCLTGSNIEQIFILTHNIYFHQEICFKDRRENCHKTKEHFWVLRKVNEITEISGYEENQIKSSYELLWQEYKNPATDSALICNTMRRILEHYFNIIGHKDYSKLIDKFEGQDKLICKTLLPYINTGSHTINDDFHLSIDKDMVDNYKQIFRKIFEHTNQIEHYNMMMGVI